MEYILKAEVNPNDKPYCGASGLDSASIHVGSGASYSRNSRFHYPCTASSSMESVRLLLQHGARWVPDDQNALNYMKRSLYLVDKCYTVELIKLLVKYRACEGTLLRRFISSDKMVGRLANEDLEKILGKLVD